MLKLFIFTCLLGLALAGQLYTSYYTPGLGYYAPGVAYARSAAVVPLAYARLHAPGSEVHSYNSVETPNSFQQQYRSDYKPTAYEYIY